jgi:Zn-dependent protease
MFDAHFLQRLILAAPVILFSLTVHEFFHGYLAYRLGDPPARDMGRLTFNPLAHLELFGVIVMVITSFRFGWAKPVPVDPRNFSNPRRDDIIVSAGGPVSNMALAFIAGMIYRVVAGAGMNAPEALVLILQNFVYINLTLAFFNLIPLFPLDGSHILANLLPLRYQLTYESINRFAPILLIILLFTGVLGYIIWPPVLILARAFLGY